MRHPQLHAALRSAGLAAARELAARVDAGDEVPFELLEHARRTRSRGARPTLYSYRPLVGLYVERHAAELEQLPAVAEAAHTMVAAWGIEAYLQARGVARPPADPHERAGLAVRQFLERLFEDAPDFAVRDEHFDRAFAELDAVLTADATETVVAIPLVGVEPAMATVAITRGVALQRPEALRGEVPEAALAGPDGTLADAVATLRWAARPGSAETPRRAREAARRLVTALRLHFPGAAPSAGPLVWLRAAGGPWRAMALGGTFSARGLVVLDVEDVPDLRTFVDLVARRLPERGEVAWALRRWTLALDRDRPEESLSDLLLAGRALLEPEGPRSGRLAGRLAALCATGDERTRLAQRLARLALQEQEVVAGSRRIDRDLPERVDELADCLRAVLRDSVCGHLQGDLVEIAEQILDGVVDAANELEHLPRDRRTPIGWPAEPVAVDDAATADDDADEWTDAEDDAVLDPVGRWSSDEEDDELEPASRWTSDDALESVGPRTSDDAGPTAAGADRSAPVREGGTETREDRTAGMAPSDGAAAGLRVVGATDDGTAAAADPSDRGELAPRPDPARLQAAPPRADRTGSDAAPPQVDRTGSGAAPRRADRTGSEVAPSRAGTDHPHAPGRLTAGGAALDGAAARHDLALDGETTGPAAVSPRGMGAARDARDGAEGARAPVSAQRPPVEDGPPPFVPFDPTGEIVAARLSTVDRRQLWLDVTWDEPQLGETGEDDDSTGPWPVAGTG